MALYTCTQCGKKVPWEYEVCPYCRTPRPAPEPPKEIVSKKKKHPVLKTIFAILAIVIVVGAVGSILGGNGEEQEGQNDSSKKHSGETSVADNQTPIKASEETVEEQTLLDESGITIKTKGFDKKGIFGPELKLLIENNTEKDLTVQVRSASINGYMVETIFSSDAAAGKKANDEISFMKDDLEACGIETIADMEFSFHIFSLENLETYLDSELIKVETSSAGSYTYTFDDSGDEIYSGNGIRIVSKGFSNKDSIWGPSLVVFIENESDQSVTVQVRDVSINGYMVDTIFSSEVSAGKRTIDGITAMNSSIEENSIESIEEIEFFFHIFTTDGWKTIEDTAPIIVKA